MDGVLLVDKPPGPTSHDVVARLRRTSGERAIGHAGTLDPRATGLLVLVLGRATRLAAFLTSGDKAYDAIVRLGRSTDTDDADGHPLGPDAGRLPDLSAVAAALDHFRGTFEQVPPAHSAKRVGGVKAYDLARRARPAALAPVTVTVRQLELVSLEGARLVVRVTSSAGFYVRALARDVGARLGCGAHLEELRRTRSGSFSVDDALSLAEAERLGPAVAERLITPAASLPELPAVHVTASGLERARHGNWLGPEHLTQRPGGEPGGVSKVRVLEPGGRLIALADAREALCTRSLSSDNISSLCSPAERRPGPASPRPARDAQAEVEGQPALWAVRGGIITC